MKKNQPILGDFSHSFHRLLQTAKFSIQGIHSRCLYDYEKFDIIYSLIEKLGRGEIKVLFEHDGEGGIVKVRQLCLKVDFFTREGGAENEGGSSKDKRTEKVYELDIREGSGVLYSIGDLLEGEKVEYICI